MCVSGYMLLKIRVGTYLLPEVLFIITELVYLHFSVSHVESRIVAPSFSLANSFISADVCQTAARGCYKNT